MGIFDRFRRKDNPTSEEEQGAAVLPPRVQSAEQTSTGASPTPHLGGYALPPPIRVEVKLPTAPMTAPDRLAPTPHVTAPQGPANEARLEMGGTVSVSDEDKYQDALAAALQGIHGDFWRQYSTLHLAAGNPHAPKAGVPVIEVRVGGRTVGFLTPAMTKRYLPFLTDAEGKGRVLTATTVIDRNPNRTKGPPIEVSLLAIPRLVEQRTIAGLDVEVLDAHVLHRRTRTCHLAAQQTADGWSTACGRAIAGADALVVRRTKPYVGWVDDHGMIVEDPGDSCQHCESRSGPGGGSSNRPEPMVPDAGRYGKQTDITGKRAGRTSSARADDEGAMLAALADGLEFDVAGESFREGYPGNLLRLAEVLDALEGPEYLAAALVRDPANRYDRNAIEIHVPSGGIGHVGFVPSDLAKSLAPVMDRGTPVWASAVEVRIGSGGDAKPGLTVCVYTRSEV